jgi:DNA uptake protein ComE-like DNA-binding protein
MNLFESHFWYTKRQRNGILLLVTILIILQIILIFVDFSPGESQSMNADELHRLQQSIDSLEKSSQDSLKETTYRFNPNFISDFKAYQLGISVEEADRLFAFRSKGKYVNSPGEFQEVTGVNDSLLTAIAPLFKFPEWTQKYKSKPVAQGNNEQGQLSALGKVKDLNAVSADELAGTMGISDPMAKRIVSYRRKLQGFYENDQLFEVYFLDPETGAQILNYYQVIEKPTIKKININTASFKEVLKIPYVDYKLTKKIFQYRDHNLRFDNLEELKKIDSFPIEKFDRIALYLSAQ